VPDSLAIAEPEQILGSEVEIGDDEIRIECDDGNAEARKNVIAVGRRTGALARAADGGTGSG